MEQPFNVPEAPKGLDSFAVWFTEVFRLWSAQWTLWTLYGLVFAAVPVVLSALSFPFAHFFGAFVYFILMAAAFALFVPGMVIMALKQMRGQPISGNDITAGMNYFAPAFLVSLVTYVGVVFWFVGGFVIMGLFCLALPALVDRNLIPGDAFEFSSKITSKNLLLYLLFFLVMGLLASAGIYACCIGVIFTWPWLPIAMAVAYERTVNPAGAGQTTAEAVPIPPTPEI